MHFLVLHLLSLSQDIGSGNFGVTKLCRNKKTGDLVAIKFIKRGSGIDKNVEREILNHRSLRHSNIIQFKEVFLTPTHLGIVMEYASGGELVSADLIFAFFLLIG